MLLRVLKDLIGGWNSPKEGDSIRLACEHLNQSQHEKAVEILSALLERNPDCVEGLILRGTVKRAMERPLEAVIDLTRAAALAPDDHRCLYELAVVSYVLGDTRLALEYCERLRLVAPELNAAYMLQSQIQLRGEDYFQILARILDFIKPRTYVEIGIEQGNSIRLVKPPTLAIGIDPSPQLTGPPPENFRVFAETSDAFFAGHDLHAELGGLPVDLAFIDGMHQFEFALRDFANLERYGTRDSTILIHDCYPLDRETADRDRHHVFWSGDTWRLIVLLKKYRPDLSIHTIGTPPTGLGLVRNLDPGSSSLLERYDRLYEEFLSLDYSYLDEDKAGKLNLFPNEWEKIRALLDHPRPAGAAPR
jgi:tetratricopeptide (TPR) repeat protein